MANPGKGISPKFDYDELMEKLAAEVAEEIDGEIMFDMLQKQGWSAVELPYRYSFSYNELLEVDQWLEDRAGTIGKHHSYGHLHHIFENEEDATMFLLRFR